MNKWYSKRGARRGLLVGAFAALCWLRWVLGYVDGLRDATPIITSAKVDPARGAQH